jgi:hypothetical protein
MPAMSPSSTISFRTASDHGHDAVVRELADLDSSRPPATPVVIALVDGRPVAAASLVDGSVVADPFVPTADVVELLQAHVAASARAAVRPRRRRWSGLPRLRPAA